MSELKDYYGSDDSIARLIESRGWGQGCFLGQAIMYIYRAGEKPGSTLEQDLEKAIWCLNRVIKEKKTESHPEAYERPVLCRVEVEEDGLRFVSREKKVQKKKENSRESDDTWTDTDTGKNFWSDTEKH